jgi:glycerol uptake facilitator protein
LRRNTLVGELSAELLGTFTLIVFGVGVVAQTVLTPFSAGAQSIHWAWGLGVVMGIYVAGGISGAHINPAVTLALALRRAFPWGKVLPYWLAQVVGAFLAALVVRWNFWEAFDKFDPAKGFKSQVVFNTYPNNAGDYANISQLGALRDQIIGTAMLLILVLAITDARNMAPGSNMAPLIIGLAVVAIGMAIGAAAGYAINPARDLGPRLAAAVTGWGGDAFNDQRGDFYAWVPIIGPFIGGVLGAYIYDFFIGNFLPTAEGEVGEVVEDPGTGRRVDTSRPETST